MLHSVYRLYLETHCPAATAYRMARSWQLHVATGIAGLLAGPIGRLP